MPLSRRSLFLAALAIAAVPLSSFETGAAATCFAKCNFDGEPKSIDVLASSVAGVRFTDGSVRPTFDLILHPH